MNNQESYSTDSYQTNDNSDIFNGYQTNSEDIYRNYYSQVEMADTNEVLTKSFIFMFAALLVTAFAAFTVSPVVAYYLFATKMFYAVFIGELVIVHFSNKALSKNKPVVATVLFTVYSYLTGVMLSLIFMLYTTTSVVTIFLVTSLTFAIMALIGKVTKKDLSSVGNLLLMSLTGIIIISLVNIFLLKSSTVDLVISIIAVLVFMGLTAYDTQKIKKISQNAPADRVLSLALFGAFELYLDFINLFLRLLRIFGKRK